MSTAYEAPQEPTAAEPAAHGWRLWVLLVWHPGLGAALDPVAVLGFDTTPNAPQPLHLNWVPLVYGEADPWRARLAEPVDLERITGWAAEDAGTCAIAEAPAPAHATSLGHATELLLDELLAEVIPSLPARRV